MPTYNYICDTDDGGCGKEHNVTLSMSQYDNFTPQCPTCGSFTAIRRDYNKINVMGGDASPKTLGALAELNTSKMSDDERHALKMKHTEYLRNPTSKLPECLKPLSKDAYLNKPIKGKQAQ